MANNSELKVVINNNYNSYSVEVWVFQNGIDVNTFYNITENGIIVTIKDNAEVMSTLKPFLKLPVNFAEQLFKALTEYNTKAGIKTQDQNLIEGKLQATEEHLKDMQDITRKLLIKVI